MLLRCLLRSSFSQLHCYNYIVTTHYCIKFSHCSLLRFCLLNTHDIAFLARALQKRERSRHDFIVILVNYQRVCDANYVQLRTCDILQHTRTTDICTQDDNNRDKLRDKSSVVIARTAVDHFFVSRKRERPRQFHSPINV